MAHCDWRDVQAKDYFLQVHQMATLNEDTTAAAVHVLEQAKFTVFIPQHVLTLGQNYVPDLPTVAHGSRLLAKPAMDRLKTERDETAQKNLLLLLWYAQTDAADHVVSAFAGDAGKSSASRTYAQELVKRKDKVGAKQRAESLAVTEPSLRQNRRDRMKSVSDEALIDLDDFTAMLIAKRK